MPLIVRPFQEADYPAIVRVFNACEPDIPWDEAAARDRDSAWDYTKYVRHRYVADLNGRVIGYGQISHHLFAFHPHKFTTHVMVEPEYRRRGAGTALYEKLLEELRARDVLLARCDLSETHTETIDFIAKRGFVEVARFWESRLDLTAFDVTPFAGAAQRTADHGIEIRTVAEERERTPDYARRAYQLHAICAQDEPSLDKHTMPDFERWRVRNVDAPDILADASAFAIDPAQDHRYVGMTFLYKSAAPHILKQSFTGVLPGYRGRGLALALKLAGIRAAKSRGFREIRTENDSLNLPMLRVNERLGFQKQPPSITFEKRLRETPDVSKP